MKQANGNPGLQARQLVPVACLALALIASGCDREPVAFPVEPGEPVRTGAVEASASASTLQLPGVVQSVQRSQSAFLQPGYLATREVVRGEQISRGQVLATLYNPALAPAVDSARARVAELDEQIAQAERELTRAERLAGTGAVSQDELDRVRSRRDSLRQSREQARAGLEESLASLTDSALRAPFDGRVMAVHAEPGDHVAAGQPVLSLAGMEKGLEVEVSLPGQVADHLTIGQVFVIEATDSPLAGAASLREIGLAGPGRPAPAILDLSDEAGWQTGQPVRVLLEPARQSRLVVPLAALVRAGTGQASVYVIQADRAVRVPVSVGRLRGDRVEILARDESDRDQATHSIEVGDRVVIAGHERLGDGDRVRILP